MLIAKRVGSFAIFVLSAVLLAALLIGTALSERYSGFDRPRVMSSVEVECENGTGTYNLPGSIPNLPAHSRATVRFTANVQADDVLFLHSVYSSYKVYAGGRLVASVGTGSDAPPCVHVRPSHRGAHHPA